MFANIVVSAWHLLPENVSVAVAPWSGVDILAVRMEDRSSPSFGPPPGTS